MPNANIFRPKARLLLQLGDELIKNESIAISELVKNSYDAGAEVVDVELMIDAGYITVRDDGVGMSADTIHEIWMEPGTDNKKRQLESFVEEKGKRNTRRPLGEKGIGRFSVHKLGMCTEIVTRAENNPEIKVVLDWAKFETVQYLDEIEIETKVCEPAVYTGSRTGTQIRISGLRKSQWTKSVVDEIQRSVKAFTSPFSNIDKFEVRFTTDQTVDEYPSVEDIKKWALYEFKCKLAGNRIVEFDYWFRPYKSMEGLEGRHFRYRAGEIAKNEDRTNFEVISHMVGKAVRISGEKKKVVPPIDLNAKDIHIGSIVVEGFVFDRRAKVLKLGGIPPKQVTSYLDSNGGVRVYRDRLRVYDYGEPENDWLGLEKSRLYDPSFKLNKGLLLAAVHLDRRESLDLHEKTNREGFIDNEAYRIFRKAVSYAISTVEDFRNEDKEKVKGFFGETKNEPVLVEIGELKEIIENKVNDEKIRKECIQHLEIIEKNYRQINEVLMTGAGAGLHLSSAIHEVSKIIKELKLVVKKDHVSERVYSLVQHLSGLMDTYTILIRRSKEKSQDLKTLVSDSLFNVQYRLKVHEIDVIKEFESYRGKTSIVCTSRLVMGAILNLIDNSIYWLERWNKKDRKIFITLKYRAPRNIVLIVADNGAGFGLPPVQMIRPFVGTKPGGMGLGLHITSEVMLAQGGSIEFPKAKDVDLPSSFNRGAIVSLVFKLEE